MNKQISEREDRIVEKALAELEKHTGIKGTWKRMSHMPDTGIDGKITLDLNLDTIALFAEVKRELRPYQLERVLTHNINNRELIIVAENIFPKIKEQLRARDIPYLDGAGNLFIKTPNEYIWLEGNKPIKAEKKLPNRAFTKAGLKVLFVLLSNHDAIKMPFRKIAEKANVALGNIPLVFGGLKDGKYLLQIDSKHAILQNKKDLLNRWIIGYHDLLRPSLSIANYEFFDKKTNWETLPVSNDTVWGGEPAASILTNSLNPEILTLYTNSNRVNAIHWRLIPNPKGRVQFYKKFWADDSNEIDNIAPYLIIYADLLQASDPRCIEAATDIYDRFLKHTFEE